jgi:hypothetical protein
VTLSMLLYSPHIFSVVENSLLSTSHQVTWSAVLRDFLSCAPWVAVHTLQQHAQGVSFNLFAYALSFAESHRLLLAGSRMGTTSIYICIQYLTEYSRSGYVRRNPCWLTVEQIGLIRLMGSFLQCTLKLSQLNMYDLA